MLRYRVLSLEEQEDFSSRTFIVCYRDEYSGLTMYFKQTVGAQLSVYSNDLMKVLLHAAYSQGGPELEEALYTWITQNGLAKDSYSFNNSKAFMVKSIDTGSLYDFAGIKKDDFININLINEVPPSLMEPKASFDPSAVAIKLPGMQESTKHPTTDKTDCGMVNADIGLYRLVQHLNDYHMWTREAIADWLETLDIDLRFKSKEEQALDANKAKLKILKKDVKEFEDAITDLKVKIKKYQQSIKITTAAIEELAKEIDNAQVG